MPQPTIPLNNTTTSQWYDRYRKCEDGANHEGRLELITWTGQDEFGEELGWGNCIIEECADMKRKFDEELKGDEENLYRYWPQAFRWTCCGLEGDSRFGCDHHGRGTQPCSCDFCKARVFIQLSDVDPSALTMAQMGKRVPDSIHDPRMRSMAGRGLDLARGPDPRSKQYGPMADMTPDIRALIGLPN